MAQEGYKTKQRDLILQFLIANQNRHVTAEDVADHLKQSGNPVGKATVYRYLDKLVAKGDVRKFLLESSGACYQYAPNSQACAAHFHLKCLRCKALIHLHCDFMSGIEHHILQEHRFQIDASRTVFYGFCADCQTQKNEKGETI